jgi:hypothetical protein
MVEFEGAAAPMSRRGILGLAAAGATLIMVGPAVANRFVPDLKLKPGEFQWQPDRSTAGPVVIIVSLPEQLVHVYRDGVEIGVSTCSTGRPGHVTPTGVFTILEKERKHVSSIYRGAQMPNMERLTWGGIALHAGNLPGYPASHGCVRLPLAFSANLFEVTHLGTVVIIADERTQPASVVHPGAMLPDAASEEVASLTEHVAAKKPHGSWDAVVHYPVTSVVVSKADGKAYLTVDGKLSGTYDVSFRDPTQPVGTHTYSLIGATPDRKSLSWMAFGIGKSSSDQHIVTHVSDTTLRRVSFADPKLAQAVARQFHPGTTLLVTDLPAPHETRDTPEGFSVITSDHPA